MINKFELFYNTYTLYSRNTIIKLLKLHGFLRGRQRSMNSTQALGELLSWCRTRRSTFALSMMFGVTYTVCTLLLCFSWRILTYIFLANRYARIHMPTARKCLEYHNAISEKYPSLNEVYATAYGLTLYLERSCDTVIHNIVYNGWNSDHYIIICFRICRKDT